MKKTLVLYVFHEYNNLVHNFINKCIFNDNTIDFIIICNNKDIQLIVPTFVKIIYRENIGYDFGGWSEALLRNNLYKKYNNFIFVNSSVIGPFIPSYYKGKWTDIYLDGLKNDVKLFGSTINTCDDPINKSHVQSYIFSMNKSTLQYLINCKIFSMKNYPKTFEECIQCKEILMSRKVIEKGWNIGSLMSKYKNVDFTFLTTPFNECKVPFLNDIMFMNFRGFIWNEYELVFIKGNRPHNFVVP